jgi:hypothetical protein
MNTIIIIIIISIIKCMIHQSIGMFACIFNGGRLFLTDN